MIIQPPGVIDLFDYITGIGLNSFETAGDFHISPNFPNPFSDETQFSITIPEERNVRVTISTITGRKIAQFDKDLGAGSHRFSFIPGNEMQYFATVEDRHSSRSIKMIHALNGSANNTAILTYDGAADMTVLHKASGDLNGFVFAIGDQLRFIAYATTEAGVTASDIITDTPEMNTTYDLEIIEGLPCVGSPVISHEGQTYLTVRIGDQCWMKENLNVGTMIGEDQEPEENGVIEKYCHFDDESYCDTFGGLYYWDEMMGYSNQPGAQGICPDGWHLPADEEWIQLQEFLGGTIDVGGKMKEIGTSHWREPNDGATNESGFTALPAEYFQGYWEEEPENNAFFWTSTEMDSWSAFERQLYYNHSNILGFGLLKESACSVRCVRD